MNRHLLLLAGVSILGVTVVHGAGWGLTAMFAWTQRYLPASNAIPPAVGSASYLILRIIQQAAVFSVPAFLFLSGVFVLFATPRGRTSPGWSAIRARLISLIVPYLVWTSVVWFLDLLQGTRFSPSDYVRMMLTGSTTPAYYYVPVLIQLYLLAPLVVWWAKAHWVSLLLVTAAIQASVYTLPYVAELGSGVGSPDEWRALVPKWLFVGYIFWFSFGVVLADQLPRWRDALRRRRWFSLAGAGSLLVIGVWGWEALQTATGGMVLDHTTNPMDMLYTLAVLLTFVGFAEAGLPRSPRVEQLGSQSYGIYLVHPLAMEVFARSVYHFVPQLLAWPLLFGGAAAGVGLFVPLALMAIGRQPPLRPAYRYLFG